MNILEVELLSGDLEGTEKFYTQLMGLKIREKNNSLISFYAGRSVLTFKKSGNIKAIYHFAFNIPKNRLEQAFLWASEKFKIIQVTPENPIADFSNWDAKAFYFSDNNGNILEFIARFQLNNQSAKPFGSDSILSISEIGLVVDDVPAESKKILEKYRLELYSKQPAGEHFTVLGDDNGLLLFVSNDREWYPTHIHSGLFYTRVVFDDGAGIKELSLH